MDTSVIHLINSKPLSSVNLLFANSQRLLLFLHVKVEVILTQEIRHRDHLKV